MAVTHRELAERSEQGLVESHRNGDHEAFDNIVHRYQPGLLAHARRRLGSQSAAEDAVQETLLRAYRALPRFNGEYRLGNWLHRILRNVCIDEANRRRRHLALVDHIKASEPACAHEAVPADLVALGRDHRSEVVRALDELPDSYRTAFVLRAVEELPYDEVAMACGITEDNARARVSRARNVLRRTTARFGAFVSVLGVTLRRGHRGSGTAAVNAANAVTSSGSTGAATTATNIAAGPNPALIQLATTVHDMAPAAGTAGRAIAVLASAAAVIVPAALSQGSPDPADPAVPDGGRTEVSTASDVAPEVLAVDLPADPSSTVVSVTSTTAAVTTTVPAGPRRAGLTLYQLEMRASRGVWVVGGQVVLDTDEGMLLGTLEPYSTLAIGLPNDWGARPFELTAYLTLVDGRPLTLRMSGTAAGDDAVHVAAPTTATTVPATTTTVAGDGGEGDAPPIATTTTVAVPPGLEGTDGFAHHGPGPTSGHFELTGSVAVDTGGSVALFSAGSVTGVLDFADGTGTLQVTVTESR